MIPQLYYTSECGFRRLYSGRFLDAEYVETLKAAKRVRAPEKARRRPVLLQKSTTADDMMRSLRLSRSRSASLALERCACRTLPMHQ